MKNYRKFKKKHKVFHIIIVSFAIVMLWRGVWGLLDYYFFNNSPVLSYILSVLIAFVVLYFDDFHLKELE